ncbi:hypothetical protein [Streptomyces sp. NBC_01508]|uniref:hypothetical protein n=1 Tax=Streptomyces sp. NBC_01508 TaxID=2903888 RepID=UPI00386BA340
MTSTVSPSYRPQPPFPAAVVDAALAPGAPNVSPAIAAAAAVAAAAPRRRAAAPPRRPARCAGLTA